MDKLRLEMELVPKTCWFSNLRKVLTQEEWDRVRKYTYGLSEDHSCMICGTKIGKLNAHEIWEYDEENHIQKLVGLIALCDNCHMVKHIGFAQLNGKYEEAHDHFCKVNNCNNAKFNVKMKMVMNTYNRRSKIFDWKLDISHLKNIGFEDIYDKYKNSYEGNDFR